MGTGPAGYFTITHSTLPCCNRLSANTSRWVVTYMMTLFSKGVKAIAEYCKETMILFPSIHQSTISIEIRVCDLLVSSFVRVCLTCCDDTIPPELLRNCTGSCCTVVYVGLLCDFTKTYSALLHIPNRKIHILFYL